MNERLISGYAHFASPVDVVDSAAATPAISPTFVVSAIATGSFISGFSVAATVDRGC